MDRVRIIDVGAREGIHQRWSQFHDKIEVVAFEPDREECDRLNQRNLPYPIKFLPNALGSVDGKEATLYITKAPGCSSLLPPNWSYVKQFPFGQNMSVVDTARLTLSRMDTVCREFYPDVIKVDTQGTELDILKGAGELLDHAVAVELEVEFVELYSGQPLFADIDQFMRSKGFTLRGLRRTCWRQAAPQWHAAGGQLVHGDALYLKPYRLNTPVGHIILAAYGQQDLLASFGVPRFAPAVPWYSKALGSLAAKFHHREIRRFVDGLRPAAAGDWHDPDFY